MYLGYIQGCIAMSSDQNILRSTHKVSVLNFSKWVREAVGGTPTDIQDRATLPSCCWISQQRSRFPSMAAETSTTALLIADDEPSMLRATAHLLQRAGYGVVTASDGSEALLRYQEGRVALLLLDIVMPDMSGIQVCREVRRGSTVPVILLTSMDRREQILAGFEAGADDFVPKPAFGRFGLQRIATILNWAEGKSHEEERRLLDAGFLRLDEEQLLASAGGRVAPLTALEYRLLRCLCENPGKPLAGAELAPQVCGEHLADHSRAVLETLVARVRFKIEEDPLAPACLLSQGDSYLLAM